MSTAIVTGGARGIGAATARALGRAGHRVALLDIDDAAEAADAIGGLAIRCDVARRAEVEAAVDRVEHELGPVALLVNNAGVGGPFHRVDEVSDEEWDWIMGVNLKSVFLLARRLLPGMRARGFGRIVNIASIQGLLGSARSSTYVASKHGMIGYTRTIAAEWGAHGITCNAVCPGYVDTALGIRSGEVDSYRERVMAKSPTQRTASPEEIAALVAFLCGPDAGYINGSAITIDGGISAHLGIT